MFKMRLNKTFLFAKYNKNENCKKEVIYEKNYRILCVMLHNTYYMLWYYARCFAYNVCKNTNDKHDVAARN